MPAKQTSVTPSVISTSGRAAMRSRSRRLGTGQGTVSGRSRVRPSSDTSDSRPIIQKVARQPKLLPTQVPSGTPSTVAAVMPM